MMFEQLKIMDEIGVEYTEECDRETYYDYLTSVCIDSVNNILLLKNMNTVEKCVLSGNKIEIVQRYRLEFDNIVGFIEYDKHYYFLCEEEASVYITDFNFNLIQIVILKCSGVPTSIMVSGNNILIGDTDGLVYILDFHLKLISKLDMKERGMKIVTRIIPNSEKDFFVIDSFLNVIKLVNMQGEILYFFGREGDNDELYMPTFIAKISENVFWINERRNHCIWEYNIFNKTRKMIYGVRAEAGAVEGRLWEPNWIMKYGGDYYVVLSKQNSVVRLSMTGGETAYGGLLLKRTLFNYQRSCEWSEERNRYIVADTGHSRILMLSREGSIKSIVTKIEGQPLNNPRMAKWMKNGYYVADTRNNRVIFCEDGRTEKVLDTHILGDEDWIIGADLSRDERRILLIFETYILIYDMKDFVKVWDSRDIHLNLKDVHHAEWIDDETCAVANTGMNMVELINFVNNEVYTISSFFYNRREYMLLSPRMIHRIGGFYYVVNSGNSEIVCFTDFCHPQLVKIFPIGNILGLYRGGLCAPRWISEGPNNSLLISDTDNQRIVVCKNRQ